MRTGYTILLGADTNRRTSSSRTKGRKKRPPSNYAVQPTLFLENTTSSMNTDFGSLENAGENKTRLIAPKLPKNPARLLGFIAAKRKLSALLGTVNHPPPDSRWFPFASVENARSVTLQTACAGQYTRNESSVNGTTLEMLALFPFNSAAHLGLDGGGGILRPSYTTKLSKVIPNVDGSLVGTGG